MKHGLYEKLVSHIVENQEKYYRLSFSYLKNQEDALDAVQNAVCKALEHYKELKNEEAVRTWMYRIVVNESLMLLRERKKMMLSGTEDQIELSYEEKGFEPEEDLGARIDRLDEETQMVVRLRFYEELSLREIAAIMEMNISTVKSKLYRGLRELRADILEVAL